MGLPVCLFLLRSVSSFLSKFKYIDGSYYPWTYSHKEHARRTTCLYEIVSKIALEMLFLAESGCKGSAYTHTHQTNRQIFLQIFC